MRCGVMCHVILFKRRYASLSVRYTTRRAALLAVHNFGSLLNLLAANNKIIVLVASSFHAHAHVQGTQYSINRLYRYRIWREIG